MKRFIRNGNSNVTSGPMLSPSWLPYCWFLTSGLHRHNHRAVCFHLLGYFVPLGCYRLSGWNRRNPMVRLD